MTVSTATQKITYTGDGVTTQFTIPFYWIADSHIVATRETIATGAQFLLSFGPDYALGGTGSLGGGIIATTVALTSAYRLIVERILPLTQLYDWVANDTFPAETFERSIDQLVMIDQQLSARVAVLETTGAAGALTLANVGTGGGTVFRDQAVSTYNLKSLKAGTNITITNNADDITITATSGGGPAYTGATDQFLRADANFSSTLTGPLTVQSAASVDVIKAYVTGGAADTKRWAERATLPDLYGLYTRNDADNAQAMAWEVKRLANAVQTVSLGGRVLIGGAVDDGASNLQVSGVVTLGNPLPIISGGTGQGTALAALNAITNVAAASTGQVLMKQGTNATWTTLPTINVKDKGAIGDGVTDDTVAIAAAFTDATFYGVGVYFPAGTYLTAPIVVGTNVTAVRGEGIAKSKIYFKRQAYGVNASMLNFNGSTASPTLFDIGIDVDNVLFNNTWTVYYGCDNFTARNVAITGQALIGFQASAGANMLIDRCRIYGTGAAGIAVGVYCDTTATAVTVDSLYQSNVHSYSVNLSAGSFNTIRNCKSYNASVFAFTLSNCQYSLMIGNFAFESGFEGFQITDAQYSSIIGNRGTWTAAGVDFGISLASGAGVGVKYCTVVGNVIDNSYKSGIALADNVTDCVVADNTLHNCGVRGMVAPPQGMMGVYTSAAGKVLTRNRFHNNNCTSDGAAVTYGFLETQFAGSTIDYTLLDQNSFTNVTTEAVLVGTNSRQDGRFSSGVALIGVLRGANMNSTADQAIRINCGRYRINNIFVENASISLTTAAGGFYTGAGKTGTILVAAAQTYVANTAANKQTVSTLAAGGQDTNTVQTIYLSLTTAQGAAATADIYVYGYMFGI